MVSHKEPVGMLPVQPHIQAGDQLLRSICKCQVVVCLAMMCLQVWPHCPHLHREQNVWGQSVSRSEKREVQGERVEREVGGGIGMGNTCKPMAVLFQCMTKFTTNK